VNGHHTYVLVPYALLADLYGVLQVLEADDVGRIALDDVERAHFRRILRKVHRQVRACYQVRA